MRAVVIALADLGKSARMQYHARALAASGVDVDLVGFEGTALSRAILDDPRIAVHRFLPATQRVSQTSGTAYAMVAVFDTLRVSLDLWGILRRLARPDLVLMQNPPAFPTLAVDAPTAPSAELPTMSSDANGSPTASASPSTE